MYHGHPSVHHAAAAVYAAFPLELQMAYQPTTRTHHHLQQQQQQQQQQYNASSTTTQQYQPAPSHHHLQQQQFHSHGHHHPSQSMSTKSNQSQQQLSQHQQHHHHNQQQQQQPQHSQQLSQAHHVKRLSGRGPTVLWHTRPSTPVTNLYPELLAMIFSYLQVPEKGRVAQVCRSWKEASYHKSVWRGVEAKLHLKKSNPTLFQSLVRRGIKRIQILSLQKTLKEVTNYVPNIDSLVLTGCFKLTDEQLMPAFGHDIASLTELNLSMCKRLTDKSIAQVTHHLRHLESLDLSGCSELTNQALVDIERNLRRLRHLSLRSCKSITDSGIAHLCGQSPRQDPLPLLKNKEPFNVASSSSSAALSLSSYSSGSAGGGFGGSSGCSTHERTAASIEQSSVEAVEQERGLGATLESLGLQDCQKLTDDSLKHISIGLKSLRTINLSFCAGIFEFGLKHLSTMTELRELNLRSCDNVTDVGLRYLSEGTVQLYSLDISFCDKVGDAGLSFIAHGMPQLSTLCLNSCTITDEGLVKLAQNLSDLKVLNIGQCSKITDKGLNALAEHCVNLNSIDLYGCQLTSTMGLERVMHLPHLSQCNLDLWQTQQTQQQRRCISLAQF